MTYRYTKLDDHEGLDGGPRYEIEEVCGFVTCVVDDEDTARLFCAALDLLEALQEFMTDIEGRFGEVPGDCTAYSLARAAIAKVTGGAS